MSYILEALKKSERERNKGKIPDLQSVHVAPARVNKRSLRPWIYALVVSGNLVFAGLWLYQKYGASYQAEKVEQVEEKQALEQAESTEAAKTEAIKESTETTLEVKQKEKTETEYVKSQESPIIQPVPEIHKPELSPKLQLEERLISPSRPPMPTIPPAAKAAPTLDLPLITELPREIAAALPALEFFSHMYSGEPQYRSVIINGEYLKENQKLSDQLMLEEITEEGVILNYQGVRFRVSVLKDWSFQ